MLKKIIQAQNAEYTEQCKQYKVQSGILLCRVYPPLFILVREGQYNIMKEKNEIKIERLRMVEHERCRVNTPILATQLLSINACIDVFRPYLHQRMNIYRGHYRAISPHIVTGTHLYVV